MSGAWIDCALVMLPSDVETFADVLRQNFAPEDVICTMTPKLAVDLPTVADEARFLNVLPTLAPNGEWLKPDGDPFYLLDVGCLAEVRHFVECGTFVAVAEPVVLVRLELRSEEVRRRLSACIAAAWPKFTPTLPARMGGDRKHPGH
jgi:hypothetical protein